MCCAFRLEQGILLLERKGGLLKTLIISQIVKGETDVTLQVNVKMPSDVR